MARWNGALHPRDVFGRFALVNGYSRGNGNGNGNGVFTAGLKRATGSTRLGDRAQRYGKKVGARFVGGVMDAGQQEATRRAGDLLAGRRGNGRVTRHLAASGPFKGTARRATKYTSAGQRRQRVINRYNAAKYSPGAQRARAGARSARASAGRVRQRASTSRAGRFITTTNAERVTRAIHRTNRAHKTFPYATGVAVKYARYYRQAPHALARRPRNKGGSALISLIGRR